MRRPAAPRPEPRRHTRKGSIISPRRLIILGSTGSIGVQTLDVIRHLNGLAHADESRSPYEVVALAAGSNEDALRAQCREHGVARSALASQDSDGPARLVREVDADIVVAAVVGFAGLAPTLAAAELGRTILLANKESLVAAGHLVMAAAARSGARVHPIDSEHAAGWLCMRALAGPAFCPPTAPPASLSRLVLTASGGPFRRRTLEEVRDATPAAALDHPNWSMGSKVTIDSATLTNKALELIEARWLFGLGRGRLDAVIHPQSTVHALAECADGSFIAQLAPPDMRIPIQLGLTAPEVAPSPASRLDLAAAGRLDFEPIDPVRWPAMEGAWRVIDRGGAAGAVFSGANEAAVRAFLAERIPFGRITDLSLAALEELASSPGATLGDIREADRAARAFVESRVPA